MLLEQSEGLLGEVLRVERRRREFAFAERDDRHSVLGNSGGDRFSASDAPDAVEQQLANLGLVAAHGQLELGLVRNDVVLGAGMEAADRDYRRIERVILAADQSLQRDDDPRGEHDRVLGRVRIGAVAAEALHQNIDAVDVRQRVAGSDPDRAGGQRRRIVECEYVIGLRESFV